MMIFIAHPPAVFKFNNRSILLVFLIKCQIVLIATEFLTEKLFHYGYQNNKLLKKHALKLFHRCITSIQKYDRACRFLIKNSVAHPNVYGNIGLKHFLLNKIRCIYQLPCIDLLVKDTFLKLSFIL